MRIIIKNFQKKIPINPKRIKKAILKVFSREATKKSGEITVCFVSDKKIKELNSKFLHKEYPTDVLAFDFTGPLNKSRIFADIVISTDTACRNAKIFKTTYIYELNLYLIHGILHLLGYDDRTQRQKQLIYKKEREYVNTQN